MPNDVFSLLVQEQLPSHCAPTSLSACLAVLGIDASQREIARAAGKPFAIYDAGLDEHEIKKAAVAFGARCTFLLETDRRQGPSFAEKLRSHLRRGLPAVVVVWDFAHWVSCLCYLDDKDKFVVMDPTDNDAAFRRRSERKFLAEAWNNSDDDEEPSQFFAILVERADGRPAKWKVSRAYLDLCAKGSANTADQMAKDLREVARRAGGSGDDVPLESVLEQHREGIVDAVDYWTAQTKIKKAELRELLEDFEVVAAAAGLRIPSDANHAAVVAQMTTIVATYAWMGEL